MSDTITNADRQTAARVLRDCATRQLLGGVLDDDFEGDRFDMLAARLEAESARDEEAEKLAQRLHERLIPNERARGGKVPAWFAPAIRDLLDVLAADGRLLPEGGTDWQQRLVMTEAELEQAIGDRDGWERRLTDLIYTFATEAEVGEWSNVNELDRTFIEFMQGKLADLEQRALPVGGWLLDAALDDAHNAGMDTHDWELVQSDGDVTEAVQEAISVALNKLATVVTPPTVPVPDSGPDGTPEKPWPNLRAVPVPVREVRDRHGLRWERHSDTEWRGCDWSSACAAGHPEDAPFVRVDGGQA